MAVCKLMRTRKGNIVNQQLLASKLESSSHLTVYLYLGGIFEAT